MQSRGGDQEGAAPGRKKNYRTDDRVQQQIIIKEQAWIKMCPSEQASAEGFLRMKTAEDQEQRHKRSAPVFSFSFPSLSNSCGTDRRLPFSWSRDPSLDDELYFGPICALLLSTAPFKKWATVDCQVTKRRRHLLWQAHDPWNILKLGTLEAARQLRKGLQFPATSQCQFLNRRWKMAQTS